MAESVYPRNVQRTLKLALTDTPVVALLGPPAVGQEHAGPGARAREA